ncbi:MAG: hypothetical protein DI563_04325 [Variovorax paradoxus]|uniref:Uncharacterized protein n=1 Tax=Variovorax paradoxus TaxID=34073 RepID=A0A2W5QJ09_VARPD|nr:MAG: hypothetical protein DI563_04325 [Variovorax paradoxus]
MPPVAQAPEVGTAWLLATAAMPALSLVQQWLAFWSAWHRGCAQAQRELLDLWIARFGGGVPLDG